MNTQLNKITLHGVLEAAHAGVYLVSSDKLGSAILTKSAYSLFRVLAGPDELKTHSAVYMPETPLVDLDFLGTLEIKALYGRSMSAQSKASAISET